MKLLMTLLFFALVQPVNAGNAPVKVNLPCGSYPLNACPYIVFYDRSYPAPTSRQIAVYAPGQPQSSCTSQSMSKWRIGHPKDGVSGFSATDWQDINIIKAKPAVATNWRWGDCCASNPYNAICLY
jgi:hypothetical protein